jgi:geranylgeranyl pyrophosphate synthase
LKRNLGIKDVTEQDMDKVVEVLTDCGAQAASREYLQKYYESAVITLDSLALTSGQKQTFRDMLDKYRV